MRLGNMGPWPARGAALLLVTLVATACMGGDDAGYHVIVENRSSADLIIVMEGAGFDIPDLGGTPHKAFLVPANATASAGPWVYVGWSDATRDWKSGHMRLYSADCQAVAEFEVRAGIYALTIDPSGAASIAPYGRNEFPDRTPKLAFSPRDCP